MGDKIFAVVNRWDNCRVINIFLGSWQNRIATVSQSDDFRTGALHDPKINWCAWGDTSPEIASLFSKGVQYAAKVAEIMAKTEGGILPENLYPANWQAQVIEIGENGEFFLPNLNLWMSEKVLVL